MSEATLRELGEEAQAVLEAGVVGAHPQLLVPLQADLVERALDERGHASLLHLKSRSEESQRNCGTFAKV